jgi:hypothetical protein
MQPLLVSGPASRRPFLVRLALVAVVAGLFLTACSGASAPASTGTESQVGGDAVSPPDVAPRPDAAASGGFVVTDGKGNGSNAVGADADAMIVKTGTLSLEVADVDAAAIAARKVVSGLGGYASGTEAATGEGGKSYAYITFRIPAARWDEAMTGLRAVGTKVLAEQTNAVEVTGQVLDLDARIRNLKATETALLGIMTKATKISDILAVQEQLTTVQGQIEQLTTERAHLAEQAALGTLSVQLNPPYVAVTQAQEKWDLAKEIDRALAALVEVTQGLASLGIWLAVVILPALLLLALMAAIFVGLGRRLGLHLPGRGHRPEAGTPATGEGPGEPPAA